MPFAVLILASVLVRNNIAKDTAFEAILPSPSWILREAMPIENHENIIENHAAHKQVHVAGTINLPP